MSPVLDVDVELIVAFLVLLQDVEIKVLAFYLQVEPDDLMEFLEYLQVRGILEFEQSLNSITLLYHTLDFEFTQKSFDYEEILLLGYLKGREVTTFREISEITGMAPRETIFTLVDYIIKGYIRDITYSDQGITAELSDQFNFYDAKNLTRRKRIIIGYLNLRVTSTFDQMSLDLNIPLRPLVPTVLKLLLNGIIDVRFKINTSFVGEPKISIYYRDSLPPVYSRHSYLFSESERMVLGYASLEQRPKISSIERLFGLTRVEIIEVLSILTHERRYMFFLVGTDQIIPREKFTFSNLMSLEELDSTSIFDYHALTGIIGISRRIRLSQISERLNERPEEIYRRVIELYLQNHLIGHTNGSVFYLQLNLGSEKSQKLSTLTSSDRVLLGALISRGSLSWLEIRAMLNLEREVAIQRAYSIMGKVGSFVTLYKDKEIRLDRRPKIPPLLDSHSLSTNRKVVLGLCRSRSRVRVSTVAKLLGITPREGMNILFFLIGSGLIVARQKGSTFRIRSVNIQPPLLGIKELPEHLQKAYHILKNQKKYTYVRLLGLEHDIPAKELIHAMYVLVADGYLDIYAPFFLVKVISTNELKVKELVCRNCGADLVSLTEPCQNCLARPDKCVVCRVGLTRGDQIATCPNCTVIGHRSHFEQWLDMKSSCPSCRIDLTIPNLVLIGKSQKSELAGGDRGEK